MLLSDIIEECENGIKERVNYIFDAFQKHFPNIRYDERSSIVGVGEPERFLMYYFRKDSSGIFIKFKASEQSVLLMTDISEIDDYIQKTIEMFQLNEFSIKKNKRSSQKTSKKQEEKLVASSPLAKCEFSIQTQQIPGVILFENYEQLKVKITEAASYYLAFEYSPNNTRTIVQHYKELKHAKNILTKTRKEIIKSYNAPLESVKQKIDELIDIIKEPFARVDAMVKEDKMNTRKYEIYIFSKGCAISYGLKEHIDKVFKSSAFFEKKWLNASYSSRQWQADITTKLEQVARDISYILSMEDKDKAIILAQYYQTLSMRQVEAFLDDLNQVSSVVQEATYSNALQEFSFLETEQKCRCNTELNDIAVLKCIANSVNPFTGELITGIDETLRMKLKEIAEKMEILEFYEGDSFLKNKKKGTTRVGQKWTKEEEQLLIEEFKQGLSNQEIAENHNRKSGGIRSRLRKMRLIEY